MDSGNLEPSCRKAPDGKLLTLPFNGFDQKFVVEPMSKSPFIEEFSISAEKVGLAGMIGLRQHTLRKNKISKGHRHTRKIKF